ncbi:hypothetical protein K0040_00995 [Terrisporobacter petrolearius]|uniref:hypothetical protein n=1 Tax=Terrisporobacter petrolearius TaxID=1460447 RepID=UPI001D16BAB1|nr:hypothetical protein [Terrisporobacter petrolearius]MCC3862888.1 hypothetical protein [Terrisporobacter petrolearius]
MDKFKVKKVDNCFKNSQTYEYKLNVEINTEFLEKFQGLGKLEIKNFRRPIFMIDCENENKIKGVINSKIIRVSFPDYVYEERKEAFEKFLNELL